MLIRFVVFSIKSYIDVLYIKSTVKLLLLPNLTNELFTVTALYILQL